MVAYVFPVSIFQLADLRQKLFNMRTENSQLVSQNHRLLSELEDSSHQLLMANSKVFLGILIEHKLWGFVLGRSLELKPHLIHKNQLYVLCKLYLMHKIPEINILISN